MERLVYKVEEEHGIHARPAGRLVSFLKTLSCDVMVRCGEREADGKKLLSVMALGAKRGEEMTFLLRGAGEPEGARALRAFLEEQMPSFSEV